MSNISGIRARQSTPSDGSESTDRPSVPSGKPQLRDTAAAAVRTNPEVDAFYRSLRFSKKEEADVVTAQPGVQELARVQGKLDAVRDRFSGPYQVEGRSIEARPMFRMTGGMNTPQMRAHRVELEGIAARAHAYGVSAQGGYGSPENLVKVTQALINAGKLPPGTDDSLATRIRDMQWEWGIGVDCAQYTHCALSAATGKSDAQLGIKGPGMENFTGLSSNKHFARVDAKDVRSGDVITLRNPNPRDVGHNVIVHAHIIVDAATRADLSRCLPTGASAFLQSPGPHHVIVVDSSWSAGEHGDAVGGFRRDTWIYDEGAKTWGYVNKHVTPETFHAESEGPCGETFHGAFRAR